MSTDPPPAPATEPLDYRVQLDGVRALAIGAVFVAHATTPWPRLHFLLPWGDLGVRCFFVLSGFLITSILLRTRARVEAGGETVGQAARRFYARRALRIFPLFYAALFAAAALDLPSARHELPWHASYLSNYYLSIGNRWEVTSLGHFWTLAVEEQFYALWPWLVLLAPRRALGPLLAGLIAAGPLTRAALVLAGVDPTGAQRFTPSCLDSLALGALLALLEERGLPWRRPGLLPACALVGAAGVAMRPLLGWTPAVAVWTPLGTSLLSFALVAGAARGFAGPAGRLLSLRPIVYLGKISYGLYVLHLPILGWAVPRIEAHLGDPLRERPGALALVGIALSVAAAAASWHAFERPLNQLKRRFR